MISENIEVSNRYKISRDVIRGLKPLCKQDNYHWLLAILKDYSLIAISIYLTLGVSYWFYPISLFVIGSTQRAFTNILHEASHNVLAKNKVLNYIAGTYLSGYLVFHFYNSYSYSHIKYHHVYLGDKDKDPDYNFHIKSGLYNSNEDSKDFFIKNILLALTGYRSFKYIQYVIKDRIKIQNNENEEGKKELIPFLLYWIAILSVCVYFDVILYFLAFWLVPLFTFAVAIGWIVELSEHYPLPESENEALLLTRNRKGAWWENFFFGRHNDNYHLVHHLHPGIPHWNMKKAHIHLMSDTNYARWDRLWGGIFTRKNKNEETLLSYAKKYREYKRLNEKNDVSHSFAKYMLSLQ
ncbi:fatty acid desaturase family protein [Xenorhabdus miraniensis]|uniref:Fatty acid desaturase n=1 Tax=Xenorhabdus miraniensis TaxID=351674 RepID=A0A2D0JQT7_9GAMM|nr:fatty acid desaturase family protein [Xenorhabdus miraniensis]PHM48649.1 fatty acid desaturase [Xenorhabdus miraniensis]PHM48982.1 fatty acid desaturase [Xenorhabdus miraniensis]